MVDGIIQEDPLEIDANSAMITDLETILRTDFLVESSRHRDYYCFKGCFCNRNLWFKNF